MNLEDNGEIPYYLNSSQGTQVNGNLNWVTFDFSNRPLIIDDIYKLTVTVARASIKVTYLSVNEYNNIVECNGVNYTIPSDNYVTETLITALNALEMVSNTIGDTEYYVVFSLNEYNNFIQAQSEFTFYFGSNTTALAPLGLTEDQLNVNATDEDDAFFIFSSLMSDLSYTTSIFICSPQLINNSRDSFSDTNVSNIIASVPVTVNSYGIIQSKDKISTTVFRNQITTLDIQMKDDQGNFIPFNGGFWNITLLFKVTPNRFIQDTRDLMETVGITDI